MFERFTERARQVVVLAQDEARMLRHDYIGTEHILLGLLRKTTAWPHGCSTHSGSRPTASAAKSPVTPVRETWSARARFHSRHVQSVRSISPFARDSRSGVGPIGTEHLLLGLVSGNDGVAVRILDDLDADSATIRKRVMDMLGGPTSAPGPRPRPLTDIDASRPPSVMRESDPPRNAPRFTGGCRRALRFAQEEARALNHAQMGTEHSCSGSSARSADLPLDCSAPSA